MLNRYPLWKYLLILVVLAIGFFFALPNLYGDDPALQISADRGAELTADLEQRLVEELRNQGAAPKSHGLAGDRLTVRFGDTETQLKAQAIAQQTLGDRFIVALDLATATPQWLLDMGALPMYLGLDLRGGVHFLLEVDMPSAIKRDEERLLAELRNRMREEKIRSRSLEREPTGGLTIELREAANRAQVEDLVAKEFTDLRLVEKASDSAETLRYALTEQAIKQARSFALKQNITTLRNRVNELGVAEPVIQQQGDSRIVVQLPGIQDPAKAKDLLGATATLEFRMVDEEGDVGAALNGRSPLNSKLYRTRSGEPILLSKQVIITGDYITDASAGFEQRSNTPAVFINLDGRGARLMSRATRPSIGKRMAVVFIENKVTSRRVDGELKKDRKTVEEVINVAVIRDELSARFQISGLDDSEEAHDLALLLRAGALAAPIEIIEERTVGPSLGQDNIDKGFASVVIGFALVLVFMAVYYRAFGMIANLALAMNLVMIVAILSMFQATLTLPGIAGIVLTVGMAVDANVLIFQRIREELANGNSPQASIHAGYEKAFSTIADANVTTLIAAIVLFGFGSGPVKGFAITLCIGILTSMFTAIMGTRAVVNLLYGGRKLRKLSI